MCMTITELLSELRLPAETTGGFELFFEDSLADFKGVPECMTMEFVRKYYPWTESDEKHYVGFERVAAKVAASPALQLYAHHAHKALFVYPEGDIAYSNWPTLTEYLGEDSGYFDIMTALGAIPLWVETHKKMGIPEEYSRDSAKWLKGTLQIYNSAHPNQYGINRVQTYWLRWNVLGKLFRIGRFEYMDKTLPEGMPAIYRHKESRQVVALCPDNWGLLEDGSRTYTQDEEPNAPIRTKLTFTENTVTGTYISPTGVAIPDDIRTLDLTEYETVFAPDDLLLDMHIPGGGGMTLDEAYDSWNKALEFGKKYLKKEVKGIYCYSWIFNPDFEQELPNSNLARLMQEVYLYPGLSHGGDGLFFIFGRSTGDMSTYQKDNSVRRAFHRIVESGRMLHSGGMFILPEEIKSRNCKKYRNEG